MKKKRFKFLKPSKEKRNQNNSPDCSGNLLKFLMGNPFCVSNAERVVCRQKF